ncbi:MAG: glycosyltransferase family 39 protein [Candidatus Moranbacteria bacterium]|nr:glycosyltransferase family 39 protein [Candidatus Moranbacteria bacterium]MDD3964965.1 glycosyltransferase family 39 protein [Candidatus Moranbacteria bacterium]
MSWKSTLKILILILVLGTAVRLYNLDQNSFVSDEFLDMNSSYGYTQTGEWKAWDFNFGKVSEVNKNVPRDERATIYKWQVAQVFHLLAPTEKNARLVSVLWGVISMGVIFWSAYVFTKRKEIGLIASLLFAFSMSGIIFDRTLRMYAMFLPMYLATSTFAFLALEKEYLGKVSFFRLLWKKYGINAPYILLAGIFFVLSLLTHQLTGTFVFFIAVYLAVRAFQEWRQRNGLVNKYALLFGSFVIALFLVAIFLPKFFQSYAAGLFFFENNYGYVKYILREYYHPLLGVILLGFGSWWLAKREKLTKESLWLTLSLLIPLSMAIWLWRRNMGAQYIYFAESFAGILTAVGIFGLWRLMSEKYTLTTKRSLLLLSLVIVLVPNFGYFFLENNTYHETSSGSNPNYRKVLTYFKKNQLATDVLVTRNMRNYYFAGAKVPVYDLGDEISKTKLSQQDIEKLMTEYKTGWIILSDNDYDYVAKGMKEYFAKNLVKVSNDQVRGSIDVFTWGR